MRSSRPLSRLPRWNAHTDCCLVHSPAVPAAPTGLWGASPGCGQGHYRSSVALLGLWQRRQLRALWPLVLPLVDLVARVAPAILPRRPFRRKFRRHFDDVSVRFSSAGARKREQPQGKPQGHRWAPRRPRHRPSRCTGGGPRHTPAQAAVLSISVSSWPQIQSSWPHAQSSWPQSRPWLWLWSSSHPSS